MQLVGDSQRESSLNQRSAAGLRSGPLDSTHSSYWATYNCVTQSIYLALEFDLKDSHQTKIVPVPSNQ